MAKQREHVVPPVAADAAAPRWARLSGLAAAILACAVPLALGVRDIAVYDIGYHLAYGEHFLDTGQIVQTNRFIYTRLDRHILSDPDQIGPGCRYDPATNTYYFVNANWLTQVAMAAAHRAGGTTGLCTLQAALVAAIFAVISATLILGLRRIRAETGAPTSPEPAAGKPVKQAAGASRIPAAGKPAALPWHLIACAVLLTALTAYERFNLRPEVFGYLMLVGQWCLLMGPGFGPKRAAGVVVLQVLAVNVHSYFLLGIALTGAMFLEAGGRWAWARWVRQDDPGPWAGRAKWLGVTLAGVILAALANPWFFRGAMMPVQTLLFLRKYDIAGATGRAGPIHPWAAIGEFHTPFREVLRDKYNTYAFICVLGVAVAALPTALLRRRLGWAAVLAGMMAVALGMRRNIAPASMILVPLSVIVLADGWRALRRSPRLAGLLAGKAGAGRGLGGVGLWSGVAASVAAGGLAGAVLVAVVTNRFYFWDERENRFGFGNSAVVLPLDAAEWLSRHRPAGRIFCDYDTSSNLMYFTRPHPEVPILTNTWAYPPYVMQWVLQITARQRDFAPVVRDYDINVVVLHPTQSTFPLVRTLARDRRWALVHVGVSYAIFLRRDGPNRALAERYALNEDTFDLQGYIERIERSDPVPALALNRAAGLLFSVEWEDSAEKVWRACLRHEGGYYQAMSRLGRALVIRGKKHILRGSTKRGLKDWEEAEKILRRALAIRPGYKEAESGLQWLGQERRRLTSRLGRP